MPLVFSWNEIFGIKFFNHAENVGSCLIPPGGGSIMDRLLWDVFCGVRKFWI